MALLTQVSITKKSNIWLMQNFDILFSARTRVQCVAKSSVPKKEKEENVWLSRHTGIDIFTLTTLTVFFR